MNLISTLKCLALTAASTILVLFGAYYAGGRAARRAAEMKRLEEATNRARTSLDAIRHVEEAMRLRNDDGVYDELRSDWMRR